MFKNFWVVVLLASVTFQARAFVPEASQVIRFQSILLKGSKPFSSKGSFQYGKNRMETLLEWFGSNEYKFLIRDVPASLYANGEGSSTWVLMRQGRRCVLKTDAVTVSCPSPGFWASLELSGSTDEVASSLVTAGFLSDDAATWRETDSRNSPMNSAYANTRVALGSNGKIPAAVIEIRGPNYQEGDNGLNAPLIQFDQTFLSPLFARFKIEGQLWFIRALSDLSLVTHKNRFSKVLASRLEVGPGNSVAATILRQDPNPLNSRAGMTLPKTLTDISTLRDSLSVEGQDFLRTVLLTH